MENNNQPVPETVPQPITPTTIPISDLQSKPKMKRWKKVLTWIFGILVFLVIVIFNLPRILSLMFPGDVQLVDDSSIRLQKISVPDNENGFFDLFAFGTDSTKDFYNPESGSATQTTFSLSYTNFTKKPQWDQSLVDEVLQKNQNALDIFDKAAAKSYIQIPEYADPANLNGSQKLYPLNDWREVARLQAVRALSLSYQGNTDEALKEAVKLNKVGHQIVVGHNDLIGALVGMAIQQLGSQTILQILPYGSSSKETLAQITSEVKGFSNNAEGYKDAFRFIYTNVANSIDATTPEQVQAQLSASVNDNSIQPAYLWIAKYPYYNKPNETKNLYIALYGPQVESAGSVCILPDQAKPTIKDFDPVWNLIFRKNAVGKLFYSLTGVSLGSAITKQCQIDLVTNIAQTELALKQYQIDNGTLPPDLNTLVPQYLDAVPLDPFDHNPIRYNMDKKILYSAGLNKKDLGGSEGTDWTQMDNPTFHIGF